MIRHPAHAVAADQATTQDRDRDTALRRLAQQRFGNTFCLGVAEWNMFQMDAHVGSFVHLHRIRDIADRQCGYKMHRLDRAPAGQPDYIQCAVNVAAAQSSIGLDPAHFGGAMDDLSDHFCKAVEVGNVQAEVRLAQVATQRTHATAYIGTIAPGGNERFCNALHRLDIVIGTHQTDDFTIGSAQQFHENLGTEKAGSTGEEYGVCSCLCSVRCDFRVQYGIGLRRDRECTIQVIPFLFQK